MLCVNIIRSTLSLLCISSRQPAAGLLAWHANSKVAAKLLPYHTAVLHNLRRCELMPHAVIILFDGCRKFEALSLAMIPPPTLSCSRSWEHTGVLSTCVFTRQHSCRCGAGPAKFNQAWFSMSFSSSSNSSRGISCTRAGWRLVY